MELEFRYCRSTIGSSAMCDPTLQPLEESSSHEWSMTECRRVHNFNLCDIFPVCAMGRIVIAWSLLKDNDFH